LKTFRITVRAASGRLLTFKGVTSYSIELDTFLVFEDVLNGEIKRYPVVNTEITEESP